MLLAGCVTGTGCAGAGGGVGVGADDCDDGGGDSDAAGDDAGLAGPCEGLNDDAAGPRPEGMPLNPPVTVTSFTRTDADTRFQGDDDIYDNISLRYRKSLFGIDYEIPWTYVQGEERDQKMNLALAAGDISEFMPGIGLSMFRDMVAGDLVADITDVYEATAHPKWVQRVARMRR